MAFCQWLGGMKTHLFLALAFLFLAVPSFAAPQTVDVAVYVLNVGKFEVATGSYNVDFYLSMKCETACDPSNFEFANGRATSVDRLIDEPDEKFYRVQASLAENIDLKAYPFDAHSLSIVLEDKQHTVEDLVYRANDAYSGIDPAVTLVGWDLTGFSHHVEEHYYAPYDETYSRYAFDLGIRRIFLASILKAFLPVLFIVIAGLLALFIHEPDKLWTRLTVNTSSLIASVMFHLNVTSSIPPVGYLTFADKFMIATYVLMIVGLVSTVMMMRHAKAKDEAMLNKIYRYSLYGIPALTLVFYAGLFLLR